MTSPLLLETLRRVWSVLQQAGIPAAMADGLAMAVWKHARSTRDIDILIFADDRSLSQLQRALAGTRIHRCDQGATHLGAVEVWQFLADVDEFIEVKVDLLVARSEFARAALDRRTTVSPEVLGFAVQILTCEDLILLKLLAGRIIDQADAVALVRLNRDTLDRDYLERTGLSLGITAAIERCLAEAT